MKWLGGFLARAGAVALGVLIAKPARKNRYVRVHRNRTRMNPGWRQRRLEREMLEFLREARTILEVMNNPKAATVDASSSRPFLQPARTFPSPPRRR